MPAGGGARGEGRWGNTLVLADYLANPPAAPLCDRHVRVSTFDVRGCIRAAREAGIDGVFTVGTDQPVYTAACVAPGASPAHAYLGGHGAESHPTSEP